MLRRHVQYKYCLSYPYRVTPFTRPFAHGVFDYMTLKVLKRMGKNEERKKERDILHVIERRKDNWAGHILRRNCLITHFIEGKIEGTRR